MTSADPLDKDRRLFTQCNDPIFLRCLICTGLNTFLGHCKIFKNFPSLWWHIKREHQDLAPLEREEIIQVLNYVFKAFKRKMFPKWAYSEAITPNKVPTTSSSLLFDSRPISRIDVWEKILEIASKLKIQSELYPKFKLKQLRAIIKVVLGPADPRTSKKYLDCIIDASFKDKINGIIDVTSFCDTAGV